MAILLLCTEIRSGEQDLLTGSPYIHMARRKISITGLPLNSALLWLHMAASPSGIESNKNFSIHP